MTLGAVLPGSEGLAPSIGVDYAVPGSDCSHLVIMDLAEGEPRTLLHVDYAALEMRVIQQMIGEFIHTYPDVADFLTKDKPANRKVVDFPRGFYGEYAKRDAEQTYSSYHRVPVPAGTSPTGRLPKTGDGPAFRNWNYRLSTREELEAAVPIKRVAVADDPHNFFVEADDQALWDLGGTPDLRRKVFRALLNAVNNGYGDELMELSAEQIAIDICDDDTTFEGISYEELTPFCQEWLDKQRKL